MLKLSTYFKTFLLFITISTSQTALGIWIDMDVPDKFGNYIKSSLHMDDIDKNSCIGDIQNNIKSYLKDVDVHSVKLIYFQYGGAEIPPIELTDKEKKLADYVGRIRRGDKIWAIVTDFNFFKRIACSYI